MAEGAADAAPGMFTELMTDTVTLESVFFCVASETAETREATF